MIANEQEYRSTRAAAAELVGRLADLYGQSSMATSGITPVVRGGLLSQVVAWEADLAAYEARQAGLPMVVTGESLASLAALLVEARMARGWSHQELAERLGLPEEAITRAETRHYADIPLARLEAICRLLGVVVQVSVSLPPLPKPSVDERSAGTVSAR